MAEFKLPDVGEGLTEAEIVSWKVKEGDTVEINDIIVEIETAKSLVELPSPYAGTVHGAAGRPRARWSRSAPRSSRSATRRGARSRARGRRRPASRCRDGDRPVQPGRQRWRRGREPGRPQQGRPRSAAPRPQGRGHARRPTPAPPPRCRSRARSRPVARSPQDVGRVRRAGRCRPHLGRASRPTPPSPARSARWRSRRCASWPRTSASTSPR